ncbi:MAG: DUF1565 domain-containing protein [Kiritimatiellae bacterium]|nr:DUF1565 domain-containing protein [Kiritimatiellia bacterium]
MKYATWAQCTLSCAVALVSATAAATDYYVATTGDDSNDGLSAEAPFATIDQAVSVAANEDTIFVAPGDYETTTQWGPNLAARLVGTGETRDKVVIRSAGTYRTLRMAEGSWLENVTVVGITEFSTNADKGGAIEMSGGTVTNCVIRDGRANANGNIAGGNLYVNNAEALVVDCEIYGGHTKKRGGNVYLDNGTVRNCVIHDGVCEDNIGGNVYQYKGLLTGCTIYGGTAVNDGGCPHEASRRSPLYCNQKAASQGRCCSPAGKAGASAPLRCPPPVLCLPIHSRGCPLPAGEQCA